MNAYLSRASDDARVVCSFLSKNLPGFCSPKALNITILVGFSAI
jgi:hypothetical protein